MLLESETAFIFLILSIIHLNRNCAASHYRKIVGGCLSDCQHNSARFSVCCLNMAVGQGFYNNLIKFHSNHKNIFLERKKWKEKGVYVLLFSLSTISVVSTISASCIIVLLYALFLYVNHRRYFKTYWSGKLQTEENFLLYWYNWVRRNPCHWLLSWIV